MTDGTELKERQKATWTAGAYDEVAAYIAAASEAAVEALGIEPGMRVLDVACGTGNASIPAARLGAEVTGIDLTPKLVGMARERAEAEGLEIEFLEGDAEMLPFDDGAFDRVVSVFGVMFAPDHQRAADELVRACAAGGRIATAAWTPEGVNGRMFATLGSHMPPPPEGFQPPVLWGSEEHVTTLFAAHDFQPRFERHSVRFEFDSIDDWMEFSERVLGPVIMAKAVLEPRGKWEAARDDLVTIYEETNQRSDGTMVVEAEYLLTIVER